MRDYVNAYRFLQRCLSPLSISLSPLYLLSLSPVSISSLYLLSISSLYLARYFLFLLALFRLPHLSPYDSFFSSLFVCLCLSLPLFLYFPRKYYVFILYFQKMDMGLVGR